jgi:hypothetical protein
VQIQKQSNQQNIIVLGVLTVARPTNLLCDSKEQLPDPLELFHLQT